MSIPGQPAPTTGRKDIDVSQGATGAAIAAGIARFNLSAFMSSYLNDNDFGNVQADFLDQSSATIGTALISDGDPGPNNVWNQTNISGDLPVGTAIVRLSVFGTPVNFGPDGYVDNVSFSITAVPEPTSLGIAAGGLTMLSLARRRRRRRDGP
jgi:hypothetical protein